MSAATITFDEMERKSQETKGWALAAKNTRHRIVSVFLLAVLSRALKGLIATLTPEMMESLCDKNAAQLKKDLQELHSLLSSFCTAPQLQNTRNSPVFGRFMGTISECTEDLADRIESLAFAENDDFKMLLSKCVEHVTTAANSGRM